MRASTDSVAFASITSPTTTATFALAVLNLAVIRANSPFESLEVRLLHPETNQAHPENLKPLNIQIFRIY